MSYIFSKAPDADRSKRANTICIIILNWNSVVDSLQDFVYGSNLVGLVGAGVTKLLDIPSHDF